MIMTPRLVILSVCVAFFSVIAGWMLANILARGCVRCGATGKNSGARRIQ